MLRLTEFKFLAIYGGKPKMTEFHWVGGGEGKVRRKIVNNEAPFDFVEL